MPSCPISIRLALVMMLAAMLVHPSEGAVLSLAADDGSDTVELAPGETLNLNVVLIIRDIDPGFAYADVFINDNDNEGAGPLNVISLTEGIGHFYDRSGFELPADISHSGANEYGLVMGREDNDDWGPGTYTLDTLVIRHDGEATSGAIELTFEVSDRSPIVLTSELDAYDLYCDWPPCGTALELAIGDPGTPFIVNLVPGPGCDGDANGDGTVDPLDSGYVLSRFGCEVGAGDPDCDAADQNGDGTVDPLDVGYVLARFGPCE